MPGEDEKKLIAKRIQAEKTAAEKRQDFEEKFFADKKKRGDLIDSILRKYLPSLTGDHPAPGGSIGKAAHLASMQAEAVAAMLMTDLFISLVQILVNTPHLIHNKQFKELLKEQKALTEEGTPIQMVYMPNENNVWPTIYKLDRAGKPMFDDKNEPLTYPNGQAPEEAVRAQRYVLKPTLKQGYIAAMHIHFERMWGNGLLSDDEQLLVRNMLDEAPHHKQAHDKVRDNAMMRQMNRPGKV